jgi:hypothetical protein
MSADANTLIVRRFFEELFTRGDVGSRSRGGSSDSSV